MIKQFLAILAAASVLFAQNFREQSPVPPGNFPIEKVPQFVFIGADDCADAEGVLWLVDFLANLKNPDGSPVLATFFVNARYAQNPHSGPDTTIKRTWQAWRKAFDAGHEIGNHTFSHWFSDNFAVQEDARLLGFDRWNAEIAKNDLALTANLGIQRNQIHGFRAPFLQYNRAAYEAMIRRGFLYSSSIEEGFNATQDPANRIWPYQITDGSISNTERAEASSGDSDWGYKYIGKFPNSRMWEIPVYAYIVPHDSLADKYGFRRGLRQRVKRNVPWFDETTGLITGFDFNLFAPRRWGGAEMRANEVLATLKHTFNTHYSGNRAPFTLGIHPDFYLQSRDRDYRSAGNFRQRRKIIEDFILYVLQNPDVRIITGNSLIAWMRNPVPLGDAPVLDQRGMPTRPASDRRAVRRTPPATVQQAEQVEQVVEQTEPAAEKTEQAKPAAEPTAEAAETAEQSKPESSEKEE